MSNFPKFEAANFGELQHSLQRGFNPLRKSRHAQSGLHLLKGIIQSHRTGKDRRRHHLHSFHTYYYAPRLIV